MFKRKRQPDPVSLPGKSHGQRSLVGYSPWGSQDSDMTKVTKLTQQTLENGQGGLLNFLRLK